MAQKFTTTILQGGKTATGIVVPPEIVEALGAGKRPPVKVTIKGYTYRSSIAVMGGDFMIGISAEVRGKARVSGGGEIGIILELDTEPRGSSKSSPTAIDGAMCFRSREPRLPRLANAGSPRRSSCSRRAKFKEQS